MEWYKNTLNITLNKLIWKLNKAKFNMLVKKTRLKCVIVNIID